jgi:hypothetical protein
MFKKEMPEGLRQKVEELRNKRAVDLTGRRLDQLDTEEKRQALRSEARRKNIWDNLAFGAFILAALFLFSYHHSSNQPHPDVIRAEGILHEGIVFRKTQEGEYIQRPSRSGGTVSGRADPLIVMKLEDGRVVRDSTSWNVLKNFNVGDKVKVWEYGGRFRVDEHGSLTYYNPLPFLIIGLVFLCLAFFCLFKRRSKIVL